MTMTTPTPIDPTRAVFLAQSAVPRTIAVLAGIAGSILPALSASSSFGTTESLILMQAAALPVLAGLALISPAIAPMRPFGRLLDILATVAGLVILFYAGYLYVEASQRFAAMASMTAMGSMVSIAVGPGLWAIIAATLAMVPPSSLGVGSKPRSTACVTS